jgi:hypothetical protein
LDNEKPVSTGAQAKISVGSFLPFSTASVIFRRATSPPARQMFPHKRTRIRGRLIAGTRTSSEATSKPSRTFVDAALALDKVPQRLIQILVICRVPAHTRPFASRSIIHLFRISGAKDHGCKGFCDIWHRLTALH